MGRTYKCFLSQPVSVLSSFKCSQWCCVSKKVFYDGEIIFHLKGILKMLRYYKWKKGLIQIIVKFWAEKPLYTFLSCTKHPFEGHKISCTKTINYAHLKMKRFISSTRSGSWFLKKVSRGAHFFTLLLACTKNF